MAQGRENSEHSTLSLLITVGIVIAALYFGKQVLVPFALALLLSFVLTPAVILLERIRLGRIPSVVIVLTLAVTGMVAILWLGTTQLTDIVANLPVYKQNIANKIQAMRNPTGYGLSKVADSVEQLSRILTQEPKPAQVQPPRPPAKGNRRSAVSPVKPQDPITVELKQPAPGFLDSLEMVGIPVLHAIEEAGAVLIFTLFMLLQRSDLRNRFFRLFGEQHLNVMTTAMDDAAQRVSRYLLTQSIINAVFGLVLGLGLYFLGVPNASFSGGSGRPSPLHSLCGDAGGWIVSAYLGFSSIRRLDQTAINAGPVRHRGTVDVCGYRAAPVRGTHRNFVTRDSRVCGILDINLGADWISPFDSSNGLFGRHGQVCSTRSIPWINAG